MFEFSIHDSQQDRVPLYRLSQDGTALTFRQVIEAWVSDDAFCEFYTQLLVASEFKSFRWETPCLTDQTIDDDFQFVLVDAASFTRRKTDTKTYQQYFSDSDVNDGIVCFDNLSGKTRLIAPSPRTDKDVYGHFAAFLRDAPQAQVRSMWRVIGQEVLNRLGPLPLWLSTAGGGVAWLHVRLDPFPKYYHYDPYRVKPG